jgi:peptide methionine sulfoxide reductase MsrA
LQEQAKQLRKAVYAFDESQKKNFPAKIDTQDIEQNIEYSNKILSTVETNEKFIHFV